MSRKFIAYFSYDPETDTYFGTLPGIDGVHTQADTIEELEHMLKEAAELWLEGMDTEDKQYLPEREGTLTVDIAL